MSNPANPQYSPVSSDPSPVTSTSNSNATKRTRVLLSCGVCRASKLKCDRASPCSQCLKKGRPEACQYAPRPQRPPKPPKSMAARLRRLEGMVRGMLDAEVEGALPAGVVTAAASQTKDGGERGRPRESGVRDDGPPEGDAITVGAEAVRTDAGGQIVRGHAGATSYVGGTHFAAILQDIDELKSYFDYPDEDEGDNTGSDPYELAESSDFLLLSHTVPRNREELLSLLPEKSVIDRLMMRYFNSNSPSQHILHRPTFNKEYNQFWQDPSGTSLHWIAILFMVISLGVFFSSFQAPHELEADSPMAAMDRFKLYRGAAGTALVWGKYSQPSQWTLQSMLLYVEADFLVARQFQMNCYLLSSVLIRLMLKMGLHRDPSKLPNISPYDGEMRRRCWHLAVQIDLLVAFHLGLPAMIHGIESDTALPRNLLDTDFGEESTELPSARPDTDYTSLSYAISKAALCREFGLVARQAHSLKVPTYEEVMELDAVLEKTYNNVPGYMKVKPMEKSVTDPPMLVIQRYGLSSLYQKSRCVLHRKYITDVVSKKEHEYSRRTCLSAALELLGHQAVLYEACKPGKLLGPTGWFISTLAVNDFLLADVIVALVIQSDHYPEVTDDQHWLSEGKPMPTKDELLAVLTKSLYVWQQMAIKVPDCSKAAELVGAVTRKIEIQMGLTPETNQDSGISVKSNGGSDLMAGLTIDANEAGIAAPVTDGNDAFVQGMPFDYRFPASNRQISANHDFEWTMTGPGGYDWTQFDAFTRGPADQGFDVPDPLQSWLDRDPLDDLDFITSNATGTTSFGNE